jgi:solute carrier family 25 carnitine/acylcarnitine transporter 20/29
VSNGQILFTRRRIVSIGVNLAVGLSNLMFASVTTIDGTTLEIVVSPEKTMISSAELVQPDIYASNGVLHLVSSLLVPPGALQLTPEKYLLALNCTTFVSLVHSVNLTSLINDTEAKYTILAPKDDVLSAFGNSGLPEKGTEELKRMLQYHFIPGSTHREGFGWWETSIKCRCHQRG